VSDEHKPLNISNVRTIRHFARGVFERVLNAPMSSLRLHISSRFTQTVTEPRPWGSGAGFPRSGTQSLRL